MKNKIEELEKEIEDYKHDNQKLKEIFLAMCIIWFITILGGVLYCLLKW